MLETLHASRFVKEMGSGRTKPLLLTCTNDEDRDIEVVVKLSSRMERKVVGLIAEAIAGMLARDLDLSIPTPYLIELTPTFIDSVRDKTTQTALKSSVNVTFGSARLVDGYFIVSPHYPIAPEFLGQAFEIFAFDALIQNADRLVSNPNCLTNGSQLTVFDHELAFLPDILSPKPPWVEGALESVRAGVPHLFHAKLRGQGLNLNRFSGALKAINCDHYLKALPAQWDGERGNAEKMIGYIRDLQVNSEAAINEVLRVMK